MISKKSAAVGLVLLLAGVIGGGILGFLGHVIYEDSKEEYILLDQCREKEGIAFDEGVMTGYVLGAWYLTVANATLEDLERAAEGHYLESYIANRTRAEMGKESYMATRGEVLW